MRRVLIFSFRSLTVAVLCQVSLLGGDVWMARLAPILSGAEKTRYAQLSTEAERESFRRAVWTERTISEAEYLARLEYIDSAFGSGKPGSGANTDQGRMYLANGAPNSIHRLPSSRLFVPCEVWYYDSLPATGYRSRLQFLFYRKNSIGDFKLYSPQLHTIRALLIPQPGTRGMFGVNDEITTNDIRGRLKTSPAEEEIIDAAIGVAKGITGSGNGEILARAMSPAEMLRRRTSLRPDVQSRVASFDAPEVRVIQFWANDNPVVDIQLRTKAATKIALAISEGPNRLEQSEIPLGLPEAKPLVYIQRFFLLPGEYSLTVDADGQRQSISIRVHSDRGLALTGEAFEERPGELRIANTPDPRTSAATETIARQASLRAR